VNNPWFHAQFSWQVAIIGERVAPMRFRRRIASSSRNEVHERLVAMRALKDICGLTPADYGPNGLLLEYQDSPTLRREALLLLRDVEAARAKPLILALARQYDGQDHFYLAAIGIAVGHDPKRREIILADFEKHFPEWNEQVAKLVWELRPPQVLQTLEQRLTQHQVPLAQKVHLVDILAGAEGTSGGMTLLRLLATDTPNEIRAQAVKNLQTLLPGKWSALKRSSELRDAVTKLLADKSTRLHGVNLIAAAELEGMAAELANLARSAAEDATTRVAAVNSLAAFRTSTAARELVRLLAIDALQQDVIRALGQTAVPSALEALREVVRDEKQPLSLRQEAVAALAASPPGTTWLLDAHAARELPEVLLPEAARLLRNSPFQGHRNRALMAFPAPNKLDPTKLPSLDQLAQRRGDPAHGRELMLSNKDLGCVRCHAIRGTGGQIGPDLSMIGTKASKENLYESLINPDKAVADQFVQWTVETKQGLVVAGLLVEDTPESVVLRDALGKDFKILQRDVEKRGKSPKSLMPSDLLAYMTDQDLVDIVEYLATLKTPALSIDAWHILGPFENRAAEAAFDHAYPPEKGVDLAATHEVRSGKATWKAIRPGSDGYLDLKAFFGMESDLTAAYLYCELESPVEQDATMLLVTDEGVKLWVNSQLIHASKHARVAAPEQATIKIKLRKGKNTVLLKVLNSSGPFGLFVSVVSEQELKLLASRPGGK
jgi:putative heme-binding domain-containing protein